MLRALPALALPAGLAAATLQYAGALKSVPPFAALPLDLTALAAAATLGLTLLLAAGGRFALHAALALPLAASGALWLWWVLAAAWSPWTEGAGERLAAMVLMGPPMLAAGLLAGAVEPARRALADATLAAGALVGAGVALGLLTDSIVLGGAVGQDPERARVPYQVAGLAIATAASLAALRLVMASGAARLLWGGAVLLLGGAVLLPGGRAAFLAAGAGVALAPALWLGRSGRTGAALIWPLGVALAGVAALAVLLADPGRAAALLTLERLMRPEGGLDGARALLWGTALREAGWLGLGPGGFPVLAGMGQARGFHPHNHALEALLEGGAVGLLLWLGAFGGGVAAFLLRLRATAPRRAAEIAALTLPVAVTVMVSTDLGNRMAWFALGLLLSVTVTERRDV